MQPTQVFVATKDLKGRGVSVTQVYANNDVAKQVAGINAAVAAKAQVIATSVPDASALKDPLTNASKKGIEIITVNSGLGAFDTLPILICAVAALHRDAGFGYIELDDYEEISTGPDGTPWKRRYSIVVARP